MTKKEYSFERIFIFNNKTKCSQKYSVVLLNEEEDKMSWTTNPEDLMSSSDSREDFGVQSAEQDLIPTHKSRITIIVDILIGWTKQLAEELMKIK